MFKLLPIEVGEYYKYKEWVEKHPNSTLFHSLEWLEFVCKEHKGKIKIYKVVKKDKFCGYWPFILINKGPFKLLGSPLRGWLTSEMGPLINEPFSIELVEILKKLCKKERITYLETAGSQLTEKVMTSAGFSVRKRQTWVLKIMSNEAEQWNNLRYNCKKNIKKAQRSGIEIKEIADPIFFKKLYELVYLTYKKKNLKVPYTYQRLYLLKNILQKKILCLGAFYKGEFIGGHIWGYDKSRAYAFVSATDPRFNSLRPNNLLIWEGIRRFINIGLKYYDMYGGGKNDGIGKFKGSFGSSYQVFPHFCMSFSKFFTVLLNFYENKYLVWKKYPSHY